ncbi:hypothetical protein DCS_04763 [Drechmeria coniospora]|uniref:PLC-like phosphodiesterase n=1 Tax=Drechmeria coniospora TaxID=98403 RepID=A0A151GKX2_DRECN|nr:hypothetical protein DCS_04763 [Drechmeria coniospora]KYK57750.1 hypothetical protein DCS_04763 [Drechmeria coniospora]ODA79638.1 hypothetical protein RJ55_05232 [Drechmeria coniospora]
MIPSIRSAALALFVAMAGVQAQTIPQSTANETSGGGRACNNSPELCGKQYNAITYMGAHGASFLRDGSTGNSVSGNQFQNATAALDAGLRLLQVQVHKSGSTLKLCHTSCSLLDAGSLESWLSVVNGWLSNNPNEVITLVLVNSDEAPASDFGPVFETSGIAKVSYNPGTSKATSNWPTLESMIGQGTRVVSFVTNMPFSSSTPYLLPEFDFIFETPFEVSDMSGFNCTVDRPTRARPVATALSKNYMSLVNHFKYQDVTSSIQVPDVDRIETINSPDTSAEGNLGKHLQQCATEWNKQPNFVLVDFWDKANPLQAADNLNRVSSPVSRKSTTSTPSTGGATNAGKGEYGALVSLLTAATLLLL